MDIADLNTPDFNLQKFVSNSQEKTEWKKSSPLKTYSKKTTPSSAEKADGKSRYGRVHKPRLSMDYLSTDKKVSQYLKVDVDNQMHYFKASPYAVQKPVPKTPTTPGTPRRGRPPKVSTAKTPDRVQMALHEALDKVKALNSTDILNDLQAPVPTSTETVDIPAQLFIPKEEQLSDSEEVINEGDWNTGDLAWACVGGFPFWPCAVTKDPEDNKYKKLKALGKNRFQKEFVHVRFFGDKGRRSWIMTSHVIPFHGLDSFQSLAEETLTSTIRRKDPKLFRSFTIPPSLRKTWQAAVSEAESLQEAPRHERITYFLNMFPPTPPSEKKIEVKPEPKKRGRKRKTELPAISPSLELKKIKREQEDEALRSPTASKISKNFQPSTPNGFDHQTIKIKQETVTPTNTSIKETKSLPINSESPEAQIKTETPSSLPIKVPGKKGRPPGRRKKSDDFDFTPLKRKYTKKSALDQRLKENRIKKRNEEKKATSKDKKFKDPAYEMFYDKNFDRVSSENPSLTDEDIEKFIEKMWQEVKDQNPIGFRSREGAEMAEMSCNDSKSDSSSRSNSPPPITVPSSKTPYKRGISLFAGVRNDKVCQVCFKNSEDGEVLKCRGPCGQPLHLHCDEKPRYQAYVVKKEITNEPVVEKKKRGRPRSVNLTPTKSPETNSVMVKTEVDSEGTPHPVDVPPLPYCLPNSNAILSPDGTPTKRKRGRPRKYPLVPSPVKVSDNKYTLSGQEIANSNHLCSSDHEPSLGSLNSCDNKNALDPGPPSLVPDQILKKEDNEQDVCFGFTDEPRERYEKLLYLKRKILLEGIFDDRSDINTPVINHLEQESRDSIDSENNNKKIKDSQISTTSLNKSSEETKDQDDHDADFSLELNSSEDSVIIRDTDSIREGKISEIKNSTGSTGLEIDNADSSEADDSKTSIHHHVSLNETDSTKYNDSNIDSSSEATETTLHEATNSELSRSIFDSTEDETNVIQERYKTKKEESHEKNDSFDQDVDMDTPVSDEYLPKPETNQSIEEEVQKGESSFKPSDSSNEISAHIETNKAPVKAVIEEVSADNDFKSEKIHNNVSVENTRKSNLKLLGTLRGDSFESESSNNNLIVDDSSTDDNLLIEETQNTGTNSAVDSIATEDSQTSDKLNRFENVDSNELTKETDYVGRKKPIALDMPDLDYSESNTSLSSNSADKKESTLEEENANRDNHGKHEGSSLGDKINITGNVLDINIVKPQENASSKNLNEINTLCPENSKILQTVKIESSNSNIELKHENTSSSAKEIISPMTSIENSSKPNIPSVKTCQSKETKTDEVIPTSDISHQPSEEEEECFEVKKEDKEVRKFSKPIRQKSVDMALDELKIKEENGNTVKGAKGGEISTEKGKNKTFLCGLCTEGKSGPCFICSKEGEERIRCGYCGKVYHLQCAKEWPQSQISETAKGRLLFHCPQHMCHTCVSDNPSACSARFNNDRLVRCVICPATYHYGNYCVPAGSEVLSVTQLICPRHYVPTRKGLHHVNASWCFLCSMGGTLLCCDLCPNSFHADCLKISPPEGPFICEDCETGRYPLFGEIVWVKLGTYRWWPARILFPQEVPENINQLPHSMGEFAVEFFGSHDYYWVNRGRVFLYHDGDGCKIVSKTRVDELFTRGVHEASAAFVKWTEERANREATSRISMKPPKYVKIQSNRIVGNVNKNVDSKENVAQTCECDPTETDPCGPDSDCINRLLSVECDPQVCPAGENCCNQNFEKKNYPRLVPFKTESRGWGLKTVDAIKKGTFIIEYVGEMIDEEEYKKRLSNMIKNKDENFYFLTLDKDRMLDAGPKGNVARFMNHSCDPNCETQKWTVNGDTRVGLFALEDIKADTELVFNYNLATVDDTKVECKCGAANCAGFIGAKNNSKPGQSRQSKAQTTGDEKKMVMKKKKRKQSKVSKLSEETCFTCGNGGELLLCDDSSCPKAYHLSCLGLTKHPAGGWVCPWHQCSVCSATKVQRCTLCINSYCAEHAEGNISLNRTYGLLCFSHNPSDSGSDWSDDRGNLSEEEDLAKTKQQASRKNSRSKIMNGHVD